MIKVLTPQQLKEHNKLLKQQLLLKQKEEQEELEREEQERIDHEKEIDDWIKKIPTILQEIENLQEIKKDNQTINNDIIIIWKQVKQKSDIWHKHKQSDIEWLDWKIDKINTELNSLPNKILNEAKKLIPNDRKPRVEDIIWLSEYVNKSISNIEFPKQEKTDLSDYYTKDKIYTKEEVYNKTQTYTKKEVDDKVGRNKQNGGYNYIRDSVTDDYFTRSSTKISDQLALLIQIWGALTLAYAAKTGDYTLTASDYTVDCTANTFTITLPTAVWIEGRIYNIKNSGTGVITINTTSSQTIDGGTTATISTQYENITVQSTGANWIIL